MPDGPPLVGRVWEGESAAARLVRSVLFPLEVVYATFAGARAALYSAGVIPAVRTALPAVSIGNLTVGGTGKTPVAAWIAGMLREGGAQPAVVLRGYGGDEPAVHRTLNPHIPVVTQPDRVRAAEVARSLGCDVVVLDDAFQHRRATRVVDVVLISADRWTGARPRLLPAGPWREPLAAVRRGTHVIVTRKAAEAARAAAVLEAVARVAPHLPAAVIRLDLGELRRVGGDERAPSSVLRGETVLAISAVGDPAAFHRQLTMLGATVAPAVYRDHHRFTLADVGRLVAAAARADRAVCTLKDAVKLGPLWPPAEPLWYVSQRIAVERGREHIDGVIRIALSARHTSPTQSATEPLGQRP